MTRDEIIEIAREAGYVPAPAWLTPAEFQRLERFAALVEQRANAWRPASEPPEDSRSVEVWATDAAGGYFAVGSYFDGSWGTTDAVTHWRDVTPPSEGE